jgi:hypothetical protein
MNMHANALPATPPRPKNPVLSRVGGRIRNYRNSAPREVKLVGIGEGGNAAVQRVADAKLPNVLVVPAADGADLPPLDSPVWGRKPNIVVIVYRSGDPAKIPDYTEAPSVLVSFVLIEPLDRTAQGKSAEIGRLRAAADVFVTTSDEDFVFELVSNLAS